MRNYLLLFFLVALSALSFSQSKKKQIELLNIRIDSINELLSTERKTSADKSIKIADLEYIISNLVKENSYKSFTISDLETKISILEKANTNLNGTISKLNGEITSMNSSINQFKSELVATKSSLDYTNNLVASKNQEISNLSAQVKIISDSLKLVQNELVKLKPATKQTAKKQNTGSKKHYLSQEVDYEPNLNFIIVKATSEKVNGIVVTKNENGTIFSEKSFKDGKECGPYKYFSDNGSVIAEGNRIILNGFSRFDGICKIYHNNGRLKRKTDYRNGTAWEDRCYDENGDEIKPCPKDY